MLFSGAQLELNCLFVCLFISPFLSQINYEYAWVKEDFTVDNIATLPSTAFGSYLPVCVGQRVEILEGKLASLPELCLVRLSNSQSDGLVPTSILRYPLKTSIMSLKSSLDSEGKHFIYFLSLAPFFAQLTLSIVTVHTVQSTDTDRRCTADSHAVCLSDEPVEPNVFPKCSHIYIGRRRHWNRL